MFNAPAIANVLLIFYSYISDPETKILNNANILHNDVYKFKCTGIWHHYHYLYCFCSCGSVHEASSLMCIREVMRSYSSFKKQGYCLKCIDRSDIRAALAKPKVNICLQSPCHTSPIQNSTECTSTHIHMWCSS